MTTTYPVGLIEALTGIIGESDNDIGGLYQTRLTSPVYAGVDLVAVFVWDGTLVVLTADTSEVAVNDWIRLNSDGRYFQIASMVPNTSVTITNPEGYPVPTGGDAQHPSSKAIVTFPVETTFGWSDSGQIGVDGVRYSYGSKTDVSFDEISYVRNTDYTPGAAKQHRVESTVIDLNRNRSGIDLARRAMLVDYAEGDDLNAIGRNLGVLRLPFLASDEQFRSIIKHLAYNPKGTLYGIDLALRGLVGEGNFEIYEDVLHYPNTVFVKLIGSSTTDASSVGKAYLTGSECQPATGDNTVNIDEDVVDLGVVGGVRWKDENHHTECMTAYPSADSYAECPGGAPITPWILSGTGVSEGVHTTLAGQATEFTLAPPTDTCMYSHGMRVQPESFGDAALYATVPVAGVVDGSIQTISILDDTERALVVGIFANNAGQWQVGFVSGGAFIAGAAATLLRGTYHQIVIRKQGRGDVGLWVDGQLVQLIPYASFAASFGSPAFAFGHISTGALNQLRVRNADYTVRTLTDYFAARGVSGSLVAGGAQFDTNSAGLWTDPDDVGKAVTIKNMTIPNNGLWEIESVDSDEVVTLVGHTHENATVQAAFPTRITVPLTGTLFQYPDDIGKSVEILGSQLGNDGDWVIAQLLEVGTEVDLDSYYDKSPAKTNMAVLTGPSFVTESGLNWRLLPNFVTENNVEWEAPNMGTVVGNTLTLPANLPIAAGLASRILSVVYSQVLSAQVLLDVSKANEIVQSIPDIVWRYYPLYLADPLGYVRIYLEDITAAGVITDFQIV